MKWSYTVAKASKKAVASEWNISEASLPREASEMFQCIKYEDKREVFGFKIHSFSTHDRIKKYDDSDNEENAEKPYSSSLTGLWGNRVDKKKPSSEKW